MRMWVWSTSPLEKPISRCLALGSTRSTTVPTSGLVSTLVERAAVTSRPPIQRRSVSAARKMVSASGVPHQPLGAGDEAGGRQVGAQLVGRALQRQPLEPPPTQQLGQGA